ncbi:MAG: hypothetical protein M3417_09580 [Actinomycetota bacterium]|nr:hypothetical protein [Actinomycetota bacterium]
MPITEPARLLLFADAPRAAEPSTKTKIRRYRLARLKLDGSRRAEGKPRYDYLKRTYD